MRRTLIALLLLAFFASSAFATGPKTVSVKGHYRKDGTYVRPHMRSAPGSGVKTEARTTARVSVPPLPVVPTKVATTHPVPDPLPIVRTPARAIPVPVPVEEDAAAKAERDEKTAAALLNLYRDLIERGKREDAKFRLEKLVERYPQTRAAGEAKVLLKRL